MKRLVGKLLKISILLLFFTASAETQAQQDEIQVLDFEDFEPLLRKNNDTVYVINFWASWCVPCIKEMPEFEKLNAKYANKNFKMILVSLDFKSELESTLIPFIAQKNLRAEVLLLHAPDANAWINKVDSSWSGAIPATVIYKNNFRLFHEGSYTYNELDKIVQPLIKSKTMKKSIFLLLFALSFSVALMAQGYKVGDKAADFKLMNIDGNFVSMSDYPDSKGFIVIFTCNHCPYSVAYEERKISLAKKFAPLGYPVIAINPNDSTIVPQDSYSNMVKRAAEKGFPYPYLLDADQSVFQQYGATRTPHVFLLNKESGDLIVRYIGAIDNNYENAKKASEHYVEDAIEALMQGQTPDPEFTKAIGCTIKINKS